MSINSREASENLSRFRQEQSGYGSKTEGRGSSARLRTQDYIGLGQSAARMTSEGVEAGVANIKSSFRKDRKLASSDTDHFSSMAAWTEAIDQESEESSVPENPELTLTEKLYGKKGGAGGKVASNSYYSVPVPEDGFTRNAGGAPKEAQEEAIKAIIDVGRTLEATDDEIAMALATARYESGFNKYAAATTTSAYGLGQFVNRTGAAYGINDENRDDIMTQAQALIEHTQDNFRMAQKKGLGIEYVYAIHHDGPKLDKNGLQKSKTHVIPFLNDYKKLLEKY